MDHRKHHEKMTECQICAVVKTELPACPFCEERTCVDCLKRYLTSSGIEPHCMYCKKGLLVKHLREMVSASWLSSTKADGYRSALKRALLETQKARLPETMQDLAAEREKRLRARLTSHRRQMAKSSYELQRLLIITERGAVREELMKDELGIITLGNAEVEERAESIARLSRELMALVEPVWVPEDVPVPRKPGIVCGCPTEDCRGMVDTRGKCLICGSPACTKCCCGREKDHKCDPDVVESVRLLKKDSKQCPKCYVRIEKAGGCDQMWCPTCKITFSWMSGRETYGSVHNPHAIAWARENANLGRDITDVPCGGFIINPTLTPYRLRTLTEREDVSSVAGAEAGAGGSAMVPITSFVNLFLGMDAIIEKNAYQLEDKLLNLRVEYCRPGGRGGTEERWRDSVFRVCREGARRKVIRDVLQTARDISVSRWNNFVQLMTGRGSKQGDKDAAIVLRELGEVIAMVNRTLIEELSPYNMKSPLQAKLVTIKSPLGHTNGWWMWVGSPATKARSYNGDITNKHMCDEQRKAGLTATRKRSSGPPAAGSSEAAPSGKNAVVAVT